MEMKTRRSLNHVIYKKTFSIVGRYALGSALAVMTPYVASNAAEEYKIPGHIPAASWRLPDIAPSPASNPFDKKRVELGKKLFFDPSLSGNGNMSCATCHDPTRGWADGLPTAKGHKGKVLGRATPTVINAGFYEILMWDGRAQSLEVQALGPINNPDEMANNTRNVLGTLRANAEYVRAFENAYPGIGISKSTLERSIAMFERAVVINKSPFDYWVEGNRKAMTSQQVHGYELFVRPDKGNCAVCHQPPNFSDNGFHNIGLKSFDEKNPDLGRYYHSKVPMAKGAFKTPQLRNVAETAPYFHDGSAQTLEEVVRHYAKGGDSKVNLSPNMMIGKLSDQDVWDIVAFLRALSGKTDPNLSMVAP